MKYKKNNMWSTNGVYPVSIEAEHPLKIIKHIFLKNTLSKLGRRELSQYDKGQLQKGYS